MFLSGYLAIRAEFEFSTQFVDNFVDSFRVGCLNAGIYYDFVKMTIF